MRTVVCVILGLVLMGVLDCEAQPLAPVPSTCCFSFIGFQIPAVKIKSAAKTSSLCANKGVVVKTVKDNEFCVNPDEPWVVNLIKNP